MTLIVPAVVGSAIFLYGIVQMFFSETVQRICDSGTEYLMCADCYIDGTCEPTYISDYCFTTMVSNQYISVYISIYQYISVELYVISVYYTWSVYKYIIYIVNI